MAELHFSDSVVISRSPEEVWDLVSDVTRTGEWSPICRACWWDDGDGPRVGAHFTGHNEHGERQWDTRSEVVAADRGVAFAWEVNGGWVRWGYELESVDGGTRLTEAWDFLPAGQDGFQERYGDQAQTQIENRTTAAHKGIPATLAAIKRIAEAS